MVSKTASFKPRSCFVFFILFFVLLVPLFSFSFFLAHLTHMIKNLERLLVHLHPSTMGTKLSVISFSCKSFENSFRIPRPYYQLMNENYLVCKKRVRFSNYGHLNCMLAIHYFSFWEPVLTEERINYWFFFYFSRAFLISGIRNNDNMTFANRMTLSAITIPYSYNEAFKTVEYNIAGVDWTVLHPTLRLTYH